MSAVLMKIYCTKTTLDGLSKRQIVLNQRCLDLLPKMCIFHIIGAEFPRLPRGHL